MCCSHWRYCAVVKITSKVMFVVFLMNIVTAARAELYFNINALKLTDEQKAVTDLTALSLPDTQLPGEYRVQVNINQTSLGEYTLDFFICGRRLCPQLSLEFLRTAGVKVDILPALSNLPEDALINDISSVIPQAKSDLEFERRILNITVPQAALVNSARGDISPHRWEHGLPMLFTSYSASGTEAKNKSASGTNYSSQYLNLRSGINAGAWRLRNYSYYNRTRRGSSQWSSMQTWLERDIRALRSRLVAGEVASPGLVMDSFSFRGVSLSTQDEMLANSQRGYAPEIYGVAVTNATVEIRQNGSLLYQTFVSPGPFIVSDLYPTSTSGNLDITVREEDGSVQTYTQAFASPPVSVRRGMLKYSVTAGEYGQRNVNDKKNINQRFAQGEVMYGWLNSTTLYGGLISAEHYRSGTAGIGMGMGDLGAISLDVTHARTQFSHRRSTSGESWRMRYSKRFDLTGTNMTLAGYRYNTDGFYSFDEAGDGYHHNRSDSRYLLKNKAQLTFSQNLGAPGSLSLSAWQQNYRHQSAARTRSITGSWSKSFSGVTVSINHSQNRSWRSDRTDKVSSASFSFPLGEWLSPANPGTVRLSSNLSHSSSGAGSLTSTLYGTALEDRTLSWSVSQARNRQSNGNVTNSSAFSGALQGSRASASLGYANYYGQRETLNWGARGSVVFHPYGVTLSRPLSEGSAWALVKAPGASGVKLKNANGLSTDELGYAVVPSLMPYRENQIALDTSTLNENTDLADDSHRAVPARESLVLAEYSTLIGSRLFLTLTRQGKPLPLGSIVTIGEVSSMTNERGQVYLSGVPDKSTLEVTLADGEGCSVPFSIAEHAKNNGIVMAELQCETKFDLKNAGND